MTRSLALLLLLSAVFPATGLAANKYPPGPPYRTCPDTLSVFDIQQADTMLAPCHPATLDTVLGVRGIIIGFDARSSAYGFYMQTAGGGDFTGVDVFTGATNYNGAVPGTPTGGNLALGDEVVVYGTTQEFPASNGETEIEGPDAIQSTNDIIIRKLSGGNALPPFRVGTCHDFNWVPSSPGNQGEKAEGCLVKIRGPLTVGRTSGTGLLGSNWLVTSASAPGDSVMIDGFTLCVPAVGTPVVGTVIDSIQGILNQRTSGSPAVNSYRIQLRSGNDMFLAAPPNLVEAFPVEDNIIRVIFDRNVDVATAGNEANYSLGSEIDGSTVDLATVVGGGQVVDLMITSVLVDGETETITTQNIGAASCPTCLSTSQTLTFVNGVITIARMQAPDPNHLSPCDDRSQFAGVGTAFGNRLAFRGIATQSYGSLYYIQDEVGGQRSGISVFGPSTTLQTGHRYLIAGRVQEFSGETETVNTVYIVDEGLGTVPAPVTEMVAALRDTVCDATQSVFTGEDYEGMLVRVEQVRVVNFNTPPQDPAPGGSFRVVQPMIAGADTILVSALGGHYTFDADAGQILNVQGVLHQDGTFRILPRSDADIEFKQTTYVAPEDFSFAQLAFRNDGLPIPDSDIAEWSLSYVAPPEVAYLNVAARLPGGPGIAWVGRNVFLPDASIAAPVEEISARFPLTLLGVPDGVNVPALEFDYQLTSNPLVDSDTTLWFPTLSWHPATLKPQPVIEAFGRNSPTIASPLNIPPAWFHVVEPIPPGATTWIGCRMKNVDLDSTTTRSDWNGCMPAGCANSMKWLDDVHAQITIPYDVRKIYEQLSDLMNRDARQDGVNDSVALVAKLDLIEAYGLPIKVKYQSRYFQGPIKSTTGLTQAECADANAASFPTHDWLASEAGHGEDVEICGSYFFQDSTGSWRKDGGHTAVLTGVGATGGTPWIYIKHDRQQGVAGGTRQEKSDVDSTGGVISLPGLTGVIREGTRRYRAIFIVDGLLSESYDPTVQPPPGQHTFTAYCQEFRRTIPPGKKITITYPPGTRCANTTVSVLNRDPNPPVWEKKHEWNFNSGQSRQYVNNTDKCITIAVHNDDHSAGPFTVDLALSPASGPPMLAEALLEDSSPNNPDVYGGFSLGGTSGGSDEFGSPAGPGVLVDASIGCVLANVPGRMGVGVQELTLTRPIPVWNAYWSHVGIHLVVSAVSSPGNLTVNCPSSGAAVTFPISQPGVYEADLGTVAPTAQFSVILTAASPLDLEFDAIGVPSLVDPTTGADDASAPLAFALRNLGPTPSAGTVSVRFDLPRRAPVNLAVYDVTGRRVATLVSGTLEAGSHTLTWRGDDGSGRSVPSGLYFCRLESGDRVLVARLVMAR